MSYHMTAVLALALSLFAAHSPSPASSAMPFAESCSPSADRDAAAWEFMKSLVGTWVELDESGKPTEKIISTYRMTAGGTAILETIFPGNDEEMISVYHLDAGKLVLTHYCMMGNQPRFEVTDESTEKTVMFRSIGGGNLATLDKKHMARGKLVREGADRMDSEWLAMEKGEVVYRAAFRLQRRGAEANGK